MRWLHSMPFGAQLTDAGVLFRLWAPQAGAVGLCLAEETAGPAAPMDRLADGWFERVAPDAAAGTLYRFEIDGGLRVPDPASRQNPRDVHGPSMVIDPLAFEWDDDDWNGRPWHEAVLYELHVGTFSPQGGFAGVEARLDHLATLGVTAVELMPIADFPGKRNWGYDGVLPFAPDSNYGRPDDLKRLIAAAHKRGLMVFLDVVYNHFGPDGNYLHAYAGQFFTSRHRTPWGDAINFDGEGSKMVRDFFIHNALYWLEEYRVDGLRLDAVHAIVDGSSPDILEELADRVARGPGAQRHVHLVLENDHNSARYLGAPPAGGYAAQWNDDLHHSLHVILTGERDGYYSDYAENPHAHLARCLAEGFAYQGERSAYRDGRARGEPSAHLPLTAFVSFLQNHDQVGNRALGDRITTGVSAEAMRAALAVLLLAPSPPLLFMGEEWGCTQPFPFFCDFEGELARAVTEGRRSEFARFARFAGPAARESIPDPNAFETVNSARLKWEALEGEPHVTWLDFYRGLLRKRRDEIVPRTAALRGPNRAALISGRAVAVDWPVDGNVILHLLANLSDRLLAGAPAPPGRVLHSCGGFASSTTQGGEIAPWSVIWTLEDSRD